MYLFKRSLTKTDTKVYFYGMQLGHCGWVSYDQMQSHETSTSTSEPFTLTPFILNGKILTCGEKFLSSKSERI